MKHRRIGVLMLVALVSFAGCKHTTETPTATTIAKFRDVGSTLAVGDVDSVAVKVTDAAGNPFSGTSVMFAVTAGNGSITASTVTTNSSGIAGILWTQGRAPGAQSVTATAASLAGSPVVFTVNAQAGPAATITKVSADATNVLPGSIIDSIRVLVADRFGNPKSGEVVTFTLIGGGGSVSPASAITDVNGRAATRWTVGTATNQVNILSASRAGLSPVTFTATLTAGPAFSLLKLGIDPVNLSPGSVVDSIRVFVSDQFGNARSGEVVTFTVTAGGGTVSPTSVTTGADGQAAARWTLGPGLQVLNSVQASRAGLTPVTFSTISTSVPTRVVLQTPRIIVVDQGGVVGVTFAALDGAGNVLPNQTLTAVSRGPAASFAGNSVAGLLRGQTFIVVSSALNPQAKDSVLVIVKTPNAPVLTTDLTKTDFPPGTLVTVTVLADMRTSPERLGAATMLVTWNPAQLTYVSDADGASGVGATVNTTGVSTGTFSLAFASSAGFAGNVELRRITFRTTATVGQTGTLSLFPTELNAAGTFNNLLVSTVSAFFPLLVK